MNNINFDFEKHHFLGELPESLDNPITITLQTTRKCNLHCIYCSEDKQLSEPSTEELENFVDKVKNVKRVIVSGGEPLLRSDVFEILQRLKDQEHIVVLATNGTRINKPKIITKNTKKTTIQKLIFAIVLKSKLSFLNFMH